MSRLERRAGRSVAVVAGIGGPVVVAASALATVAAYRGRDGRRYSPTNHWISELGEEGVSRLAPVFNAAVIVGGSCLAAFMTSLAAIRRGRLARAYGWAGLVGGVAGALVGVYPINRVAPHAITSGAFFNLSVLAIALASVDFATRPDERFGRAHAGLGAASTLAYAGFAVTTAAAVRAFGLQALEPPHERDDVSWMTTLEWATLLGIMAWVVATASSWAEAEL